MMNRIYINPDAILLVAPLKYCDLYFSITTIIHIIPSNNLKVTRVELTTLITLWISTSVSS